MSVISAAYNSPQQQAEASEIAPVVLSFLKHVSDRLAKDQSRYRLAFTSRLTGSMAEGTKAFLPNEIDVICEFVYDVFNDSTKRIEETVKGVYVTNATELFNPEPLNPRLVAGVFYRAVSDVIKNLIDENLEFQPLVLHKSALLLRDRISCLHLMWTGSVYKNLMIYVDLVPAFKLPPSFKPRKVLPLTTGNQP